MNLFLKNKKVFITGSSQGIGKAIAQTFLKEAAYVLINGRDKQKLQKTSAELKALNKGQAQTIAADVTKKQDLPRLKKEIIKKCKKLDILVLNVGSGQGTKGISAPTQEWKKLLELNLLGAIELVKRLISLINKNGSIIFISSIAGLEYLDAPIAYSLAKAGICVLTKNLAWELADRNIRVNAVAPGNILFKGGRWEEITRAKPNIISEYIYKEVALKRFGTPEEIANLVVFLASKRASFITGSTIIVDGGQSKHYF